MDGILPVYKPQGMTSHDVVNQLRKVLHTKKIGHAGTLDPNVDGVLPIAIGKGTKVIEFLQTAGKTYVGAVTVGFSTTTEDLDGQVVDYQPLAKTVLPAQVDAAMRTLEGDIIQIPPMYSAVKVKGRRLYDYARAGETVERPQRSATIYQFRRTSPVAFDEKLGIATFTFVAQVSKGTYIRTLAVDLGKVLGWPAVMSRLTRQAAGGYQLAATHTLSAISQRFETEGSLGDWLLPIDSALQAYPAISLSDAQWATVKDGVGFSQDLYPDCVPRLRVYYQGQLKSVHTWSAEKQRYRPYRTFSID